VSGWKWRACPSSDDFLPESGDSPPSPWAHDCSKGRTQAVLKIVHPVTETYTLHPKVGDAEPHTLDAALQEGKHRPTCAGPRAMTWLRKTAAKKNESAGRQGLSKLSLPARGRIRAVTLRLEGHPGAVSDARGRSRPAFAVRALDGGQPRSARRASSYFSDTWTRRCSDSRGMCSCSKATWATPTTRRGAAADPRRGPGQRDSKKVCLLTSEDAPGELP
jgi:hypothetical protein